MSAPRGNVVGANIGPFQYIQWLRRVHAEQRHITLYRYRSPVNSRDELPFVKATTSEANGRFDCNEIPPGHYTRVVDDADWQTSDGFDVELKDQPKPTAAIATDVSPNFPDCKGGYELIVKAAQ